MPMPTHPCLSHPPAHAHHTQGLLGVPKIKYFDTPPLTSTPTKSTAHLPDQPPTLPMTHPPSPTHLQHQHTTDPTTTHPAHHPLHQPPTPPHPSADQSNPTPPIHQATQNPPTLPTTYQSHTYTHPTTTHPPQEPSNHPPTEKKWALMPDISLASPHSLPIQ